MLQDRYKERLASIIVQLEEKEKEDASSAIARIGPRSLLLQVKRSSKLMSPIWSDYIILYPKSIYFSKYIDPGSLENSVRRILAKILTNTFAQNFSFQDRGNKNKFEALKIWDLIQGALLQSFEGESLTLAEKVAGSWLANAKWRQQSDGTSLRQRPPSNTIDKRIE
ncbi:PREDICTED: uncharacterized protein LOC105557323 [Vollenhovia emeryi]|uniref:uncharacterized protein LOC105557323 n=1 Tax=Vollenhovia emeryi TaxID=411798 RepID=UPI0005F5651C|nr:PREDICTED: uncharacterized protein LOC105557323 [Vollenhovia emeryi]